MAHNEGRCLFSQHKMTNNVEERGDDYSAKETRLLSNTRLITTSPCDCVQIILFKMTMWITSSHDKHSYIIYFIYVYVYVYYMHSYHSIKPLLLPGFLPPA